MVEKALKVSETGLNEKEARFVDCYLMHLNASRAAKESGYSDKGNAGYRLLRKPHVAAVVRERLDEIRHQNKGLRLEVMRVLAAQLTADPRDIVNDDGTAKSFDKIPPNARLAIQSISCKKWKNGDSQEGEEMRVTLASKGAIAKTLGVFLGLAIPPEDDSADSERERIEDAGKDLRERMADMKKRRAAAAAPVPPPAVEDVDTDPS